MADIKDFLYFCWALPIIVCIKLAYWIHKKTL